MTRRQVAAVSTLHRAAQQWDAVCLPLHTRTFPPSRLPLPFAPPSDRSPHCVGVAEGTEVVDFIFT